MVGRRTARHQAVAAEAEDEPALASRRSVALGASYSRLMLGRSAPRARRSDDIRRLVAVFSIVVAILAAATDPGSTPDLLLVAVPVVGYAVWGLGFRLPLWLLALIVIAAVAAAQRNGKLEPLFFEISLLAYIIGRWARPRLEALLLGLACVLAPPLVALIQSPSQIATPIWVLGIAFPWAIGLAYARQAQLAAQLEETRQELAYQALLAERREIARDVHDLVGHGLAAVLLQVTSARHVLRRDLEAADEALRTAELAGRRSMEELRGTLTLLRSDESGESRSPLPDGTEIGVLVDEARAAGLSVELQTVGNLDRVPPGVGVALYRIAQECLANALRHAPRARTVLELSLTDREVHLTAETNGTTAKPDDPARPRYGVVGMRERAASLGGTLTAGPISTGWRVYATVPLERPVAPPLAEETS